MDKNSFIKIFMTSTNTKLLSSGILLLRLTAGIILFLVGSGKVAGWFGGFGMQTTTQYFNKMGFSDFLTYLSSYTEFIGGMLLFVGLFTRPAAVAVFINMLVATWVMMPKGFVYGGADFPFTVMIISIAVILAGPTVYSLDYLIFKKNMNRNQSS